MKNYPDNIRLNKRRLIQLNKYLTAEQLLTFPILLNFYLAQQYFRQEHQVRATQDWT